MELEAADPRAEAARAEPLLERAREGRAGSASPGPAWQQPAATRRACATAAMAGLLVVCGASGIYRARTGASAPSRLRATHGAPDMPFEIVQHPLSVAPEWGVVSRPFPTGAWYTNMAVLDNLQPPGSQPVIALPYGIGNNNGRGMALSYGSTRRAVTTLYEGDYFGSDLVVGTATGEISQIFSHRISATSPLTLAVDFTGEPPLAISPCLRCSLLPRWLLPTASAGY
jgi:hypothetical protein